MKSAGRLAGLALILFATTSPPRANAEPIVAGTTFFHTVAIQDIELLAGTPFNMSGQDITIHDLTATGGFSIVRDAQAGSTIQFVGGDAYWTATTSPIGAFELGAGPSLGFGSYSGAITNVVQDPANPGYATGQPSSIKSGDLTVVSPQFGLRVGGQLLFTKETATFTAHLDGLPPSYGTTILSPEKLGVYWTNPSTGDDMLIGYTLDRRLVVVPEPSGVTLLGLGLASLAVGGPWRRRS